MTTVRAPSAQINAARSLPPGPPLERVEASLDVARAAVWLAVRTLAFIGALVVLYAAVASGGVAL